MRNFTEEDENGIRASIVRINPKTYTIQVGMMRYIHVKLGIVNITVESTIKKGKRTYHNNCYTFQDSRYIDGFNEHKKVFVWGCKESFDEFIRIFKLQRTLV